MTPSVLAEHLFATYEPFRLDHLTPSNCRHRVISTELQELAGRSNGLLGVRQTGSSLEGRPISLVSCGRGEMRVLLWSQMHGDEATATLALMDMFNFLCRRASEESWVEEMLEQVTVHAVPMLNPDGAERVQRHTATKIDMNRDARTLATPEARLLRDLQRRLNPQWGFNLHDQELSTVGNSGDVTALALLAPALDEQRSAPPVRIRAMRVVSLLVRVLEEFAGGHLATYDDSFEPRAFGDSMQAWGTSTVLIESGHWPGDMEKLFIRKLNYIALLSALRAIGNGSYQDVELEYAAQLKPNGKHAFDIIIRGATLEHPSGWSHAADIGLMRVRVPEDGATHQSDAESPNRAHPAPVTVTVKEVGDLTGHGALETIDAHGRAVSSEAITLEKEVRLQDVCDMLQIYYSPADRSVV